MSAASARWRWCSHFWRRCRCSPCWRRSRPSRLLALLAGHVVSRFWPLLLVRGMPYLGDTSAGNKPLAERIAPRALGVAAAWSVLALVLAALAQGVAFAILPLLVSALALLWMQRMLDRRIHGFTDDALGATQQVCEAAFYFGAAVGLNVG